MTTALIIQPGQHPQITQLCDDRDFLNLSVSRDTDFMCSATATVLENGIAIIYAQEGVLLCLPGNRRAGNHIIAGTFYIAGVENGKLRSLTDAEIAKYTLQFWEPEIFAEEEIFDSWFDTIFDPLYSPKS